MQSLLLFLLSVYGLLAITHLIVQVAFAYAHHRRFRKMSSVEGTSEQSDASISVIYPVYNESPEVLRQVFEHALKCLEIPRLEIVFIDDGSPNLKELLPIYQQFESDRMQVYFQKNAGKRAAQYAGLAKVHGEYIVTVDSDTLINPEGIMRLIEPMLKNEQIGAVCGEVGIENRRTNLLTRLISLRYWSAFNLERAAQSYFGSVLCCSGPFSAYRHELLKKIKERYIAQMFCGKLCTYGDDRHLTNLVLGEGYRVVYQPDAFSLTYCPETVGEYISQQTRWNKSFYREMLWTWQIADRVHPYALLDMMMQPVLFLGFNLALCYSVLMLVTLLDLRVVALYLFTLVMMASVRSLYGLLRTRDLSFLMFSIYGFLHVFVLIPVRFKSLLTLSDSDWGTRSGKRNRPWRNFLKWAACYTVLLLTAAGLLGVASPELVSTIVTLKYSALHE